MRVILAPMEGLLDHSLRDVITAVGGIDLLRLGVHAHHRPAAARARVHAHRARAAGGRLHRGRHAGARAAARQRPGLPGRQRGTAGHAGAGRHRPQLRLPGPHREPPPRRRGAARRARAGACDRGCGAARGAGGDAGLGQDAAGPSRRIAHARLRARDRRRRRRRAGGARPHQGPRLPAAGLLGPHRAHPRGGGDSGGRQRRGLDRGRRAALPRRKRLRRADARPRHRRRPWPGAGAARSPRRRAGTPCARCSVATGGASPATWRRATAAAGSSSG